MPSCRRDGTGRDGKAQSGAGGMGCAALLWGWLLLGCSWGPGPPGADAAALWTAAYVLDDAGGLGRQFDGIGAVSGGGVSGAGGRGVRITSSGRRLKGTPGGRSRQWGRSVAWVQALEAPAGPGSGCV